MSFRTLSSLTLLLALGLLPMGAQTPPATPPPAGTAAPGASPAALRDFDEVIKDAELTTGFFPVFQKEQSVWIEIAESQLDEPFLLTWNLARGIGEN